jgi:hypothetical protein
MREVRTVRCDGGKVEVNDLPPDAMARLTSIRLDAEIQFEEGQGIKGPEDEPRLIEHVRRIFFPFLDEALTAGRTGYWTADQVRQAVDNQLLLDIEETFRTKHFAGVDPAGVEHFSALLDRMGSLGGRSVESLRQSFSGRVTREIRSSSKWKEYLQNLKHLSDFQAASRIEDAAHVAASPPGGMAGGTRSSDVARTEIENFATSAFAVARDRIVNEHADKKKSVLAQVGRTHNSGGYLPALTKWGAERLREMILAQADAYVEAFTIHGVPSDRQAEKTLEMAGMQFAAGTISGILGELDLLAKRTNRPQQAPGGYVNREINHAMGSALDEGKLRLQRQRITAKTAQAQPASAPAPPSDFWESLRLGFMQLREDCAIDPRLAPAGRLTAIWTAQPAPGNWRLHYRNGKDGSGVAKRFEWHAQSAAARLGCAEEGHAALSFWLDKVLRDAPASHIQTIRTRETADVDALYSREILDICGLSADYCRKCAADEMRLHSTVGVADQGKAESPDAAKPLVREYLEKARSKVRAVAEALKAGRQALDAAATELELEARTWGQDLHNVILEKVALECLPPEQFEERAAASAREIIGMAIEEFSVSCGSDTTDGRTPVLIGQTPVVITSDRPPQINTGASIVQYLQMALTDYPRQYRRQNMSIYKLTHLATPDAVPPATAENADPTVAETAIQKEGNPLQKPAAGARKTASEWLTASKITNKFKTHEKQAEAMGLERSVYFDLKAGRKVSEESYIRAARVVGCDPKDLMPAD